MHEAIARTLLPSVKKDRWEPVQWQDLLSTASNEQEERDEYDKDSNYQARLWGRYDRRLRRHRWINRCTGGAWTKFVSPPEEPAHVPPHVFVPPVSDLCDLAVALQELIKGEHIIMLQDGGLLPSHSLVRHIVHIQKHNIGV